MNGDTRFWQFFGGIWLLVGLGWVVASLIAILFVPPEDPTKAVLVWVFLVIGLVISTVGGVIVWRARVRAARQRRLDETGLEFFATVVGIRRGAVRINRQFRWHVRYRYDYTSRRAFEGESGMLPADAVHDVKPGDRVRIKVDPERPQDSLYLGAA